MNGFWFYLFFHPSLSLLREVVDKRSGSGEEDDERDPHSLFFFLVLDGVYEHPEPEGYEREPDKDSEDRDDDEPAGDIWAWDFFAVYSAGCGESELGACQEEREGCEGGF